MQGSIFYFFLILLIYIFIIIKKDWYLLYKNIFLLKCLPPWSKWGICSVSKCDIGQLPSITLMYENWIQWKQATFNNVIINLVPLFNHRKLWWRVAQVGGCDQKVRVREWQITRTILHINSPTESADIGLAADLNRGAD